MKVLLAALYLALAIAVTLAIALFVVTPLGLPTLLHMAVVFAVGWCMGGLAGRAIIALN